MHAEESRAPETRTVLPPDAPDLTCEFPPLEVVWTEANRHFKRAKLLADLVDRDLHAGDAAILGQSEEARALLLGMQETVGGWSAVDTILNFSPDEALVMADELGVGIEVVDDDRTEEVPQAGGSVLEAMGAANNFVELFDEVRDCALGAVTWHNIGRPDPWDGTQPELLALWTQFANTACRKGPYAACRTFSTLPPNDGWPDFTGELDPSPPSTDTPLNPSPSASPVVG